MRRRPRAKRISVRMRARLWFKFSAESFMERMVDRVVPLIAVVIFGWALFVIGGRLQRYNPPDFYEPKDAERGAYFEGRQRAREDARRQVRVAPRPPADCAKSWVESFPVLGQLYKASPDPIDSGCRSGYRHWMQQFSSGGKK